MKEYIGRQYEAPEVLCIELDEDSILCASQFGTEELGDHAAYNEWEYV